MMPVPVRPFAALPAAFLAALGACSAPRAGEAEEEDSREPAIARLAEGNERFATGHPQHRHEGLAWRSHLTAAQHPFAVLLCCSDSRVPPELVFDQGFGDLFVVRVAGNVVSTDGLGSLEYAIEHLHATAIVVMGHSGCGAVTAALEARRGPVHETHSIVELVEMISPSLTKVDPSLPQERQIEEAVESNVRWSVVQLREFLTLEMPEAAAHVELVGAIYDIPTGRVRFLVPSPPEPSHE